MRRLEWKNAIWLWGLIAVLLSVDMYSAISAGYMKRGRETRMVVADKEDISLPKKEIALTFDDGPHPVYTPELLDGLKERGVRVSFFLIGQNIEGNEEIIRRMKEEGHFWDIRYCANLQRRMEQYIFLLPKEYGENRMLSISGN